MSVINTDAKEIHCKVLYYGPEYSGKKSSLLYIKNRFEGLKKEFIVLPFKQEMYALVLSIGKVFGLQAFVHIYNVNNESSGSHKILFRDFDGMVFVASSAIQDRQKNIYSFLEMEDFCKVEHINLFKIPLVLQYNKRDLPHSISLTTLRIDLNKYNNKDFASSVLNKICIIEPLKHICKLVLQSL